MKNLCIKLEEELHKELKLKAMKKDKNLREYVTELIIKDLKKDK